MFEALCILITEEVYIDEKLHVTPVQEVQNMSEELNSHGR